MPKKSQKTIDRELREDKIRMHEERAIARMLGLEKIADFMLKNNIGSFGFIDEQDNDARYWFELKKVKNHPGELKISAEKYFKRGNHE